MILTFSSMRRNEGAFDTRQPADTLGGIDRALGKAEQYRGGRGRGNAHGRNTRTYSGNSPDSGSSPATATTGRSATRPTGGWSAVDGRQGSMKPEGGATRVSMMSPR